MVLVTIVLKHKTSIAYILVTTVTAVKQQKMETNVFEQKTIVLKQKILPSYGNVCSKTID